MEVLRLLGLTVWVFIFALVGIILSLWGIVDAVKRPTPDWKRAGHNKDLWILLQALGMVMLLIGPIFTLLYLSTIRPQLKAAAGQPT